MPGKEDAIKLAYLALAVFAEDDTLDAKGLDALLNVAMHDGVIDDEEKRILANVFNRIDEAHVESDVWNRIQSIRRQHAV